MNCLREAAAKISLNDETGTLVTTIICGLVAMTMAVNAQSLLDSAGIVSKVSPAVVVIQGQSSRGTIVGTGVIVSHDGKMATNLHVIRDLTAAGGRACKWRCV
jgi:S1-C subfamily serine protease